MKNKNWLRKGLALTGIAALMAALWAAAHDQTAGSPEISDPQQQKIIQALGKLPLYFESYQDQAVSRGKGYAMYFTPNKVTMALKKAEQKPSFVTMSFVGSNQNPKLSFEGLLEGKSNYLTGNDPKKWRTDIPHYSKVKYSGVYPGIDLEFYGNQQQLEYDWVVAPGTDPSVIKMAYKGVDRKSIDQEGNLVLTVKGEKIIQKAPFIYQEVDEQKQTIKGEFVFNGGSSGEVQFKIAAYDASKPLRIDPVLVYSTYLGGRHEERGLGIAADADGYYVAGQTWSNDFPTTQNAYQEAYGNAYDFFVTKMNVAGNGLVYSTYIGGSQYDHLTGLAVDRQGNAYVVGYAESSTNTHDFPVTANAHDRTFSNGDAIVAKLNASGNGLVYATFLGGSGWDRGLDIAVDENGNAYVTGRTLSTDFSITSGAHQEAHQGTAVGSSIGYDAFVTKFDANGAVVYSTYLGGNLDDEGHGIAVSRGNAYVTGWTQSTNANFTTAGVYQPSSHGNGDAFVVKLNLDGSGLDYATYLGGLSWDSGNDIAVDTNGNAYVGGTTSSNDFPLLNAYQTTGPDNVYNNTDTFISKLNASGTGLVYSTFLGGTQDETALGIAIDLNGNAYVTGYVNSLDFPTRNAHQSSIGGNSASAGGDAFIAKLNLPGKGLIYASYWGGTTSDVGEDITVDQNGNVYVTGSTNSHDFPLLNAYQPILVDFFQEMDAFIVKLSPCPLPQPSSSPCQYYICDTTTEQWVAISVNIDDSNPCTKDNCNKITGVVTHNPIAAGTACSDNSACTTSDVCNATGTCTGTPVNTNDGNSCTTDSCNPATGSVSHTPRPLGSSCVDNNACTTGDICNLSNVCAGAPVNTNDNNPCTTDSCNPVTGVSHPNVANGTSCPRPNVSGQCGQCQTGQCQLPWVQCGVPN